MGSTQRQPQNGKGTQTIPAGRSASAAAGARRGNGEDLPNSACSLSAEERQLLVEQIAYSRAEMRGFAPGEELQDWFEAEADVKRLLR